MYTLTMPSARAPQHEFREADRNSRELEMRIYDWAEHHVVEGEKFNIAMQSSDWVAKVPLHGHRDFCEWVFVISGKMRHKINGVTNIDERGVITLVRPCDIHVMTGKEFAIITLGILPAWLSVFDALWGTPNLCKRLLNAPMPPKIKLQEEDCRGMEDLLMKTLAFGHGIFARQHLTAFLSAILARHFNTYLKSAGRQMENAPAWFEETLEWLERNADKEITMKQLREKACRCPAHISREFLKQLHCTPTEYLLRQRLTKAANLLLSSDLPISEIAFASGFHNLSHFCRRFKMNYRTSPREYRIVNTTGTP